MLYAKGNVVEIACSNGTKPLNSIYNELGCEKHIFPFSRSPFSKCNLIAYKQLKGLVEKEHYDIVHCHTPNAAMITRLACRNVRKQGTKVFYTAHGFHFFKGAPLKNWLMYYPVEKICAHLTDVLITINHEDFELAKKKMHAKKVCYVPGVGIDLSKIQSVECDRAEVRKSMGVPEDCVLLLSIGELNVNKNHQVVVKALARLNNTNVHYAIAGLGDQKENLLNLAKNLGVESQFHLLGYRTDALKLYKAADVFVFPSFREGLSVSLMEAMASGLPIVCSKIRGNVDLVEDGVGGFHFVPNDVDGLTQNLKNIIDDTAKVVQMGDANEKKIKMFSLKNVLDMMKEIYNAR
ncbi:MAG: glycosyltransferase [Alphaproteobacteria bacterium]|nr:glycosyltransferase [Alphaproteobacteria bacterium]